MTVTALSATPVAQIQGRGNFRLLLKQTQAQQLSLHQEMEALIEQSKVRGSPLYLQRHTKPNATWMLRWRLVEGGKHHHVLWPEIQPLLDSLPMAIRKYCEEINQRATELNTLDIILEYTAKWCGILLEGGSARKGKKRMGKKPSGFYET
jgi:hypothetical protein